MQHVRLKSHLSIKVDILPPFPGTVNQNGALEIHKRVKYLKKNVKHSAKH